MEQHGHRPIWVLRILSKKSSQKKVNVTKGDQVELVALFELFDKFNPSSNFKIPLLGD
jgi:hypothetical protein